MTAVVDDLKRLAGHQPYRQHLKLERGSDGVYKAKCPFHDDKTPSLAVYEDGHFHCFGCEAHGDQLDFLQKAESIDFAESKRRLEEIVGVTATAAAPQRDTKGPGKLVATYPYVNEQGEVLLEVLRFEPKTFRQRRPDGNGGWTYKLGNVRKPLYRLPQVLQADEVWLPEGEKDVATFEGLGLTATTVAGGANAQWLSEYNETLRGKTVFIVPDNDVPGHKRAKRIHRQLHSAARKVLIVEIPAPHKDATDFIEAGNGVDDLRALIGPAQEQSTELLKPWWQGLPTLSSLNAPPVRYLVPRLLPEGSLVMLVGRPGSFKSFLSLDMGRAVSTGTSFAGLPKSKARPVLYLDAENGLPVIVSQRDLLAIPGASNFRYWGRFSGRPFPPLDAPELKEFAAKEKPLIIIDSFIRFHKGSENDNAEVAATMAHFLDLSRAGATVLLLHHAGKDKEKLYRGAMELEAAPDVCIRVERTGDREIRLAAFKNRYGQERTYDLRFTTLGFQWLSGRMEDGDV